MSTKRIALNVVATYAQTAVSLVVGLFCSRWVYNALGETQFGLFSVVGSLIAFIAILNGTLIGSSSRFFAYALGQQRRPNADKELLCKWFNTALSVQVIMPVVLVVIGGPIGVYAIKYILNIPDDLRQSCVYIFYFSLFSMFNAMIFSPVQALYHAKQYIFVRNLFGIFNTFFFAAEGWWLLHYTGNRLIAHAAVTTTLMFLSNIAFAAIAYKQFPEARIRLKYWFDKVRLKEVFSYASFTLFGELGALFSSSGVAVVLNKFFGPTANAAMGIGNQVYQKTAVFSQAVNGAISPELTARVGAGKLENAKRLAQRVCIYSSVLGLVVAVPFIVYSEEVLILWLKHPPEFAAQITVVMMLNLFVDRLTAGYMMLVHASGRIKVYITCLGIANGGRCLMVLLLLLGGIPLIITLWLGWFFPFLIITQARVWFARRVVGVSIRQYVKKVLIPLLIMAVASVAFTFSFKFFIGTTVLAILLCGALNVGFVGVLMWVLIGADERKVIASKMGSAYNRLTKAIVRAN